MEKIISSINNNKLYISAAIVVIGIIVYEIIKRTINKILEKDKQRNKLDKKGRTVVKLFTNIIKYVIIVIVGVLILQIYGVNVNSIVAGLGLVSVEAQKFFPSNELSKALRFRDSIYTFLKSKYKATKRGLDKGSKYNYYVLGYSHKKDNGLYPIKIDICRSKIIQGHTNDDTKLMDGYNVSIYYWPAAYDKIVKDYVHEDEY